MIPVWLVAVSGLFAAFMWVAFARSYRFPMLGWLAIPFLGLSSAYAWFAISDASLTIVSAFARPNVLMVELSQAVVLMILVVLKGAKR